MNEAKEKNEDASNCFNCGHLWLKEETFCSSCGQKRTAKNISLWTLVADFFVHQFSIEGRLFQTFKTLLIRPGGLTQDFCDGKRARYFSPIQLYLVTSVLFFLLLDTLSGVAQNSPFEINAGDARQSIVDSTSDSFSVSFGFKRFDFTKQQFLDFLDSDVSELDDFFKDRGFEVNELAMFFARGSHAVMQPGGAEAFVMKYFRLFSQTVLALMPVFGFIVYGLYWRKSDGAVRCMIFSAHVHAFAYFVLIAIAIVAQFWESPRLFAGMSMAVMVHIVWAQKVVFGGSLWAICLKSLIAMLVYFVCVLVFVLMLLPLAFLTM